MGEDVGTERVEGGPEYLQTLPYVQCLLADGGLSLPRFIQRLGLAQTQEEQEEYYHSGRGGGLDWLEEL